MTPRERFLASLISEPVDRFFRYEHGPWPSTRQRWLREGYPADADFAPYFGMDPLFRIMINSGYCDSPYQPKFAETVIEETPSHRVYIDSDGITKRVLREATDTSMPQFLRFPVEGRADWERVRERLDPAAARARMGDPAIQRSSYDPTVPTLLPICGAFGHPRNLFGDEALSYLFYDDPNLLHEILENWGDLYGELVRELATVLPVDVLLIWEDMCYKNGPLISPTHFRQFLLPRYQRLITAARRCGVEGIIVDTDGDCRALLPLFVEAGVDCLMPFEVQAGMDVVAIRREFGPTLGLMGGLDKRALAGTREDIAAEVERVLPFFVEKGGYVPTLDHTVPPNVPLANFQYYLECVRRFE